MVGVRIKNMDEKIIETKVEVLPLEQDFYIPVVLQERNFFYLGGAYKTKEDALNYHSARGNLRIIKITLRVKDFKK